MSENPSDPDDREDVPDSPDDRTGRDPTNPTGDDPASVDGLPDDDVPTPEDVRDELYGGRSKRDADRPQGFDEGIVDLLSWGLDTETRARIYVRLRQRPWATSEEVAEATGLYPSTVREALAALYDDEVVERRKRRGAGAGNDPYEYAATAPSELVGMLAERIQDELNAVFDIGRSPDRDTTETTGSSTTPATEPVTITVRDADDPDLTDDDRDTGDDDHDDEGNHDDANDADDE